MAKKGQPVQLQAEINNDEEWEKLLQRDGLIVVDVYSDWCGPCQGMAANLKKIKLEVGGDMLHLAVAKSDNITQLQRFRNKSEPTWMFVSKGKMVNLMFGADSPKLTRLIIAELKKEGLANSGEIERDGWEITELAEEERYRYERAESIARAARGKEEAKKAKELHERRTEECHNILNNLPGFGVIVVFPNAKDTYAQTITDLIQEAGLIIQQKEKIIIHEEMLNELLYFADAHELEVFDEKLKENMASEENIILLLKPDHGAEVENIDDIVLHIVYGVMRKPPGSPESPAIVLLHGIEEEENEAPTVILGIWAPPNHFVKATALKLFFHKLSSGYFIPEPEPTPQHLTIIFENRKTPEAMHIINQYPNEIMNYGFFTSDIPEQAQLVAKTLRKLEKCDDRTFTEKLVIQVTKKKSECTFAFAQLGPMYMSPNVEEGERECKIFFPEDYVVSDEEDLDEEVEEVPDSQEPTDTEEVQQEEEEQVEEPEEGVEPPTGDEGEEVASKVEEEIDIGSLFGPDPVTEPLPENP